MIGRRGTPPAGEKFFGWLGYWCCWIISARLVLSLLKDNRGVRSHKGKSLKGDPFFLRGTSASKSEVGGVLEWSILAKVSSDQCSVWLVNGQRSTVRRLECFWADGCKTGVGPECGTEHRTSSVECGLWSVGSVGECVECVEGWLFYIGRVGGLRRRR